MTKFQEFIDHRGFSQYRLHKLTGFTRSQISEWQHGKHRPSLVSAHRLAVKLRLPLQEIMSQLELREGYQNVCLPDGSFVARSKENSPTFGKTNDATRTEGSYCLLCHQMLGKAA